MVYSPASVNVILPFVTATDAPEEFFIQVIDEGVIAVDQPYFLNV
jgi:hypothetical protein